MTQAKIKSFLENCNLEELINRNKTPYEIKSTLLETHEDTKIPKAETIARYIKEHLHLIWDKEIKRWVRFDETLEPPKERKKRGRKKKKITPEEEDSFEVESEIEFQEEDLDNPQELKEDSETKKNNAAPDTVIQNEEKNNMGFEPKNINGDETLKMNEIEHITKGDEIGKTKNTNKEYFIKYDFDNIPPSDYFKNSLTAGSEKFSICINNFVLSLLENTLLREYNVKFRKNKSKAIELALVEFLTIKNSK